MTSRVNTYHTPVMLHESVDGLAIREGGTYVDVTFGGGGHSQEILNRLGDKGRLFAFDQDADAHKNVLEDSRVTLIHQNFRYMNRFLKFYGVEKVDGVLGDFGVSSHQFDALERGFSMRFDAELDMRMNQENTLVAKDIVNQYTEKELATILFQYGEIRNNKVIAKAIVSAREAQPIHTSEQLNAVLKPYLPKQRENKILAQIYQAIRIVVNDEIKALEEFLTQLPRILKQGGRVSLISYHSLEDRLVKRFFRDGNFQATADRDFYGNKIVPFKKIGKLIVPSQEEIQVNARARSARLRVAERL